MTRADLKHCGNIPDAREELNRSVREGRIESRHSIKSLEGMGSSSHDLGAELRMHSFTVNCETFSNEEKVSAVVPVTSVEVTCSEAMLALSFSTLLVKCLMKILGRSQCVMINGCKSESIPVTSSIPHGSVLGPLLLVIYVIDLPDSVESNVYIFTDDVKIY